MMKLGSTLLAAALLFAGFNTFAADAKEKRKAAGKVNCVSLNQPFHFSYDDGYSLEEVKALRNSIFAQYGYPFADTDVKAEQVARGCYKENPKYSYKLLTDIDKQNVKALKAIEAEMSEYSAINFEKEWKKTEGHPAVRAKLLSGNYCHLENNDSAYLGFIHFAKINKRSGQGTLEGLFDFKNVRIPVPDSTSEIKLDPTSIRDIDSTSAYSVKFPVKGTWSVNEKGEVVVNISKVNKSAATKLTITSKDYKDTGILLCRSAM